MRYWKVWATCAVVIGAAITATPAFSQGPGPFGGPGGPGGFGGPIRIGGPGGPGGPGGAGMLLRMPEVQKELKLQPAQLELISQLETEGFGKMRELFQGSQNLTEEQRRVRFETFRTSQEKGLNEILDAKQQARLKQLQIQQAGIRAVLRPDVAKELKLTSEQQSQIRTQMQAMEQAMRADFQSGGDPREQSPEERQAMFTKMQSFRTANDAKVKAILTSAQQKQLEAMKGAPFTFPSPRFQRGPGGPGGPGGPPPFGG